MLAALLFHVALEYLDKKSTQAICAKPYVEAWCELHDGVPPPTR